VSVLDVRGVESLDGELHFLARERTLQVSNQRSEGFAQLRPSVAQLGAHLECELQAGERGHYAGYDDRREKTEPPSQAPTSRRRRFVRAHRSPARTALAGCT
jgi:hypothetical protein